MKSIVKICVLSLTIILLVFLWYKFLSGKEQSVERLFSLEDNFTTNEYVMGKHFLQVGRSGEQAAFVVYDAEGNKKCKVVLDTFAKSAFKNALEVEDGFICVGTKMDENDMSSYEAEGIIAFYEKNGDLRWVKTYGGYASDIKYVRSDSEGNFYFAARLYNDYQEFREQGFQGRQEIECSLVIIKTDLNGEIKEVIRDTEIMDGILVGDDESEYANQMNVSHILSLNYYINGFEVSQDRLIVCGYQKAQLGFDYVPYILSWNLNLEDRKSIQIENEIDSKQYIYTDIKCSGGLCYLSGYTIDKNFKAEDGFVISINGAGEITNIGWLKTTSVDKIDFLRLDNNGNILARGYSESFIDYEGYVDELNGQGAITYNVFDAELNLLETKGTSALSDILILGDRTGYIYNGAVWNDISEQRSAKKTYIMTLWTWGMIFLVIGIPIILAEGGAYIWLMAVPWKRKYIYEKDKKAIRQKYRNKQSNSIFVWTPTWSFRSFLIVLTYILFVLLVCYLCICIIYRSGKSIKDIKGSILLFSAITLAASAWYLRVAVKGILKEIYRLRLFRVKKVKRQDD